MSGMYISPNNERSSHTFSQKHILSDFYSTKKIKVVVVESHNDVLNHIYRDIGSKKIPFSNLKLFHFDSHPDLCVPNMPHSLIKNSPSELLSQLHIENWIIPSIFAGHVDHVVWMHPEWCKQLKNRNSSKYFVGNKHCSDTLSVNIPESYFINDTSFCPVDEMDTAIPFGLTVSNIHEANTLCKVCVDIIGVFLNNSFILDVDLDTFSTLDPFRNFYTNEQFSMIDKLFTPPRPPPLSFPDEKGLSSDPEVIFLSATISAKVTNDARLAQLNQLKTWMTIIGSGVCLPLTEITNYPVEVFTLCSLLKSLGQSEWKQSTWTSIITTLLTANLHSNTINATCPVVQIKALSSSSTNDSQNTDDSLYLSNPSNSCSNSEERLSISPKVYPMKTRSKSKQNSNDVHSLCDHENTNFPMANLPSVSGVGDEKDDQALMLHLHDLWASIADRENDSLPHHISTTEEQQKLMEDMESILNRLHNPCLITVARSVMDGYTPANQISQIQINFFKMLDTIYGRKIISILLDYDNADNDAALLRSQGFQVLVRGETTESNCNSSKPSNVDFRSEAFGKNIV